MPKVMFVISGLGAGGAERVISQIASHWNGRGFAVEIASFDTPFDPVFHHFDPGIGLHRIGAEDTVTKKRKLTKLGDLRRLRRLLRHRRPDVVVSFLTKNNLLALCATMGLSIPVVCSERNNPERQEKNPIWNRLLAIAYRRAKLIVCQTAAVKRCFPKAVADRVRIIPNPVSAWPMRRIPAKPPRIVAVGRLTEQKGFDLLLDAYARAETKDWQLCIFGEGPQRSSLEDKIAQLGLGRKARLVGNSVVPGDWTRKADIFVLSSRYEGFPNVLGEAMAAGLPVIATRCDFGPAEMIDHGHSGLLVAPEDANALSVAIQECIDDSALRDRLGREASRAVRAFSPQRVMRMWDEVLSEVLSAAPVLHHNITEAKEPTA